MTPDNAEITDVLEAAGAFKTATLLDPATLVSVAVNLASAETPDDYRIWLWYYAGAHQVDHLDLAEDILTVLSHCGQWWPLLAKRCKNELRQMAPLPLAA
jgi:hypothetical protein